MDPFSYIANADPAYIESLYRDFKKDPVSVNGEWKKFFEGFEFALANFDTPVAPDNKAAAGAEALSPKEFKVLQLIWAYRSKGHLLSKTNPIRPRRDRKAHLDLADFDLSEADLDQPFHAAAEVGLGRSTLREIIAFLQDIYCHTLGFEYEYIQSPEEKKWIRDRIEGGTRTIQMPFEKKKRILKKLNDTVVFEEFLGKKYIGQKRFSLEGGETTVAALDAIINEAAEVGAEEVVFGMAHRGRLNMLVNIMGKTYEQVFSEFEGISVPDMSMGDGDVKYHLGYSSQVTTPTGKTVHLKLSPNPSHLEAVAPVMQGFCRAKGDLLYGEDRSRVLPVVIHGDAAVAGQGVVYEVVQMSQLAGYQNGGSIHFVINNQIGFTTNFDDARSSDYCTSVARIVHAPVIHVNGDDAEAVIYAVEMAVAFRQKFRKNVFVDMVCYRKHGHNEGDDPKFTQPGLYNLIEKHPNPRDRYIEHLMQTGVLADRKLAESMQSEFWNTLQARLDQLKQKPLPYEYQEPELAWKKLGKGNTAADFEKQPKTAVSKAQLEKVFEGIHHIPEGLHVLPKVRKMLQSTQQLFSTEKQVDWALAELLAYGTLLVEGHDVRMSGQDCKRGTFSHRHATLYDEENSKEYNRLDDLDPKQGKFRIYNSLLSEFGVLGYEFGYSLASPQTLTIWEAQFGDFVNGAQTILDQFISSGQSKWQRMSGLTLLLPHGYEGQGPEHSSARLERFLQGCAEYNMVVANVTTPANFFHLLRRQLHWSFRKPLVVMSPKSLLRHPLCRSGVEDFTKGSFRPLIDDEFAGKKSSNVSKILFCSGKIYYDLLERQQKTERKDIAIVRLEQLYPLPITAVEEVLDRYPNAMTHWIQEEPANMGAWSYMLARYPDMEWEPICRKASASPATGYMKVHQLEQQSLVDQAFS
ncbi:MAG: 2-oxoglutarate dehydrogenase E1 component [Bacteroidetes bacterium]|nr:2-oxoglutarate dehydrogenase E1 component [Bacteroidota bacterium]